MATLKPAAGYLRMSSDDQTESIDRQKAEITEYAKRHGYRIVVWFADEGKSASHIRDLDRRTEFLKMLAESASGKFTHILCWDISRFGRLDSVDGAFAKQTLRTNGVVLDTVKEGLFDWATTEGRWKDMALSEAANQYAKNLAKDSVSGRLRALERKEWPNGMVPYGYAALYTDGTTQHIVKRGQSFRKPRGWKRTLVEEKHDADIVRWLFDQFTRLDVSLRGLARDLTKRGVSTPDDGKRNKSAIWTKQTICRILRCKAYVGTGYIGKYRARKPKFLQAPETEVEGVCPVIVKPTVWHAANAKLDSNAAERKRRQPGRAGLLSGVLYCGHCGKLLRKKLSNTPSRKGETTYVCGTSQTDKTATCKQWCVQEVEAWPKVAAWLIENIESEVVRKLADKPAKIDEAAVLRTTIAKLEQKITRGQRNLLAIEDATLVPEAGRRLAEWQRESREARNRLAMIEAQQISGPANLRAFADWWDSARAVLCREAMIPMVTVGPDLWAELGGGKRVRVGPAPKVNRRDQPDDGTPFVVEAPPHADFPPERLREVLRQLGLEVVVKWDRAGKSVGKRGPVWIPVEITVKATVSEKNFAAPDSREGVAGQFQVDHREVPQFPRRQPRVRPVEQPAERVRVRQRDLLVLGLAGVPVQERLLSCCFLGDGVDGRVHPRLVVPHLLGRVVPPPPGRGVARAGEQGRGPRRRGLRRRPELLHQRAEAGHQRHGNVSRVNPVSLADRGGGHLAVAQAFQYFQHFPPRRIPPVGGELVLPHRLKELPLVGRDVAAGEVLLVLRVPHLPLLGHDPSPA